MYRVGYLNGELGAVFDALREFDDEDDAREYVGRNWTWNEPGVAFNIVIMHEGKIILDCRFVGLN